MSTHRYTKIGWSLLGLVIALSACGVTGQPKQPIELTILHTGQVAGELAPCG